MKITVRNQEIFSNKYMALEFPPRVFHATRWFASNGTSLIYFRVNEFQYESVDPEDIYKIEDDNGNVIYEKMHGITLGININAQVLSALNSKKN